MSGEARETDPAVGAPISEVAEILRNAGLGNPPEADASGGKAKLHLAGAPGWTRCLKPGATTELVGLVDCGPCLSIFMILEAQRLGAKILVDSVPDQNRFSVLGVPGRFPSLVEVSRAYLVKQMADVAILLGAARLWVR